MKNIIVIIISLSIFSCGILKKIKDENSVKKEETKSESQDDLKKKELELREKEIELKEKELEEHKKTDEETEGNKSDKTSNEVIMKDFKGNDLSPEIKYSGKIITGKKWSDKNGENILIITETGIRKRKSEEEGEYNLTKELFGYHYADRNSGSYDLLWKINDFIKDCMFDLTLSHIKNSLTITDINNNGVAESTFLYKMACRSDVSPCQLKLMMHEGSKKYALRGRMFISMQEWKEGGEYEVDKSFNDAPSGFLDYAKEQWNKFKRETIN